MIAKWERAKPGVDLGAREGGSSSPLLDVEENGGVAALLSASPAERPIHLAI
jgi:hypothetical protein